MKIISVANQKGGVGKTTTAYALGMGLINKGYKVLFVDMDPQGNLTYTINAPVTGNVYEALNGNKKALDWLSEPHKIHLLASTKELATASTELTSTGKEYKLKEALAPFQDIFDYVVIDTPPTLGILSVNALTASDYLIIPVQASIYSLQGIGQLYETIHAVKTYCNSNLELKGILLTRYNNRTILNQDLKEMIEDTADKLGTFVYDSSIRESITVKESQASQEDIYSYAPNSNPSKDYKNFVEEVIQNIGGSNNG